MNRASILAIMAHPDDAEIWAGGTLAAHALTNAAHILVESQDSIRTAEGERGAAIINAHPHFVRRITKAECITSIRAIEPQIIITHRIDDPHPDHRRVGGIVIGAVQKAAIGSMTPIRLYTCDTYESLTLWGQVPGRTVVNVDATFEKKILAIHEHKSQPTDYFSDMASRHARRWGARIGATWGEAFDPVPVLGRIPGVQHL